MNSQRNQSGMSAEKMQLFLAGLSGLSEDEVRKAKLLYLRNELSELRAIKASYAGFGVAQGCFAIIPVFWPILWAQRSGMNAALTMHTEQIRNALDVWRDDLGDDAADIAQQLNSIVAS